MDDQLPLIVQIVASVIAGHAAPEMFRQSVFGPMGRAILGIMGGVLGSIFLKLLVNETIEETLNTIAGSAISGAALASIFTLFVGAVYARLRTKKSNRK